MISRPSTVQGRSRVPLLALAVLLGAAGCGRTYQRFVAVDFGVALDTKTGQYCAPASGERNSLPLCLDLSKR